MNKVALVLVLVMAITPALAATTVEAGRVDAWQQFDIVFWQTVPFAAFWSYAIGTQLARGGAIDWNTVVAVAAAVSAANAFIYARRVAR